MPRMFDILRDKEDDDNINEKDKQASPEPQDSQEESKGTSASPPPPPLTFPRGIITIDTKQTKQIEDHSLVSKKLISEVKKHGIDSEEKAKEIYLNAVDIVKNLIEKIRVKENLQPYMDKIYTLLDDIFNQLVLGDNILDNIYEHKKDEYYLPFHIVNVLVLSSVIGLNMGFNKSRFSHLGLAVIFYDLGMDALREISGQPRKLTKEEYDLIRTHISKGLKIVQNFDAIDETVEETIKMHHERVNGKGYPRGMKGDNINSYAKILGLVDTYEAITHNRPYRQGLNAHKAVRYLLGSLKDYFDPDVMKVFINKMSVYPIGSIVRLDTQELARVISVQPGSPLRPVVMIIQDTLGGPVKERRIIDLSKQDFPSIKDSI